MYGPFVEIDVGPGDAVQRFGDAGTGAEEEGCEVADVGLGEVGRCLHPGRLLESECSACVEVSLAAGAKAGSTGDRKCRTQERSKVPSGKDLGPLSSTLFLSRIRKSNRH